MSIIPGEIFFIHGIYFGKYVSQINANTTLIHKIYVYITIGLTVIGIHIRREINGKLFSFFYPSKFGYSIFLTGDVPWTQFRSSVANENVQVYDIKGQIQAVLHSWL